MSEWKPPKIQELDQTAFVLIREYLYRLLHELHMTENYRIVYPKREHNVYWENFCELVESLPDEVSLSIYREFIDSQSSG